MLNLDKQHSEIGIWFIKLYSLSLVQFLNQIPISECYFTQIQHTTSLLPILIARQKTQKIFESGRKKKNPKIQAGFEPTTTAPPVPALAHCTNPARRCWIPFFATFIHLVTIILTLGQQPYPKTKPPSSPTDYRNPTTRYQPHQPSSAQYLIVAISIAIDPSPLRGLGSIAI